MMTLIFTDRSFGQKQKNVKDNKVYYRLSHAVVTWDVAGDVSTAYWQCSLVYEID